MVIEVLAILVLVDQSSFVPLLGWFILAEILCPLGSSSAGGPEGDGARAAVMGDGNVGREVEERWRGGGGRGGREVIITGFHLSQSQK